VPPTSWGSLFITWKFHELGLYCTCQTPKVYVECNWSVMSRVPDSRVSVSPNIQVTDNIKKTLDHLVIQARKMPSGPLFCLPSLEEEISVTSQRSLEGLKGVCVSVCLSHQTSTKLKTYGRFWSGAWDSVFHHHQQNTKLCNFSWKNGVTSLQ
jgi:hypothetical protein